MCCPESFSPRHHLLISGTGRAGTSFLVRYLAGMGMETHLDIHGDGQWFEEANAGFEDLPVLQADNPLPYVIKSPWLCEFVDTVLENPAIRLDAVIIPVRDLVEAATSRVVLELQSIHRMQPLMAELDHTWESWGQTPGGVVFSLNPIDQARLLAVWFHRLIERLTSADIPVTFLSFPRLIEDSDYLFEKLRAFLPPAATAERARTVHERIADATKVRMTRELAPKQSSGRPPESRVIAFPCHEELDRLAIRRELTRLNAALSRTQTSLEAGKQQIRDLQAQLAERESELRNQMENTHASHQAFDAERQLFEAERRRLQAELDSLAAQIDTVTAERDERIMLLQRTAAEQKAQIASFSTELAEREGELGHARARELDLRRSMSWRITAVLRWFYSLTLSVRRAEGKRRTA